MELLILLLIFFPPNLLLNDKKSDVEDKDLFEGDNKELFEGDNKEEFGKEDKELFGKDKELFGNDKLFNFLILLNVLSVDSVIDAVLIKIESTSSINLVEASAKETKTPKTGISNKPSLIIAVILGRFSSRISTM